MKAKIILGLGLVALLASGLSAGDFRHDREHRVYNNHEKSHKHIKRDHHRDSHYMSRSEKREMRKMMKMKRRYAKLRERRMESRIRAHEFDRALRILSVAIAPQIVHERHLAFGGYRY